MVNSDLIHYGSLLHYSMMLVVMVDKGEVLSQDREIGHTHYRHSHFAQINL